MLNVPCLSYRSIHQETDTGVKPRHVHFSFTVVVMSPAKEIASAPEEDLLPPTLQV